MRFVTKLVVLVVYLLHAPAASAELYKCKDAKGRVQYSDSPCASSTRQLALDGNIQFENSAQGRLNSEQARRSAETRHAREDAAKCETTITDYRKMLADGNGLEARKRQENLVTATCGSNELLTRGIIQPPQVIPVVNVPRPIVNVPPPIIFMR